MWVSVFDGESVRTRGFEIVRRDGTTGWLSHVDMNIPFCAFGKIFTQRAFRLGPPKLRRAVDDAGQIDLVRVDWFAENPLLCHFTVLSILVMELGFPLVYFLRSKRTILAFLVAMTAFRWLSAIFAEVNFWVTPALLFALFYPFGETPSPCKVVV